MLVLVLAPTLRCVGQSESCELRLRPASGLVAVTYSPPWAPRFSGWPLTEDRKVYSSNSFHVEHHAAGWTEIALLRPRYAPGNRLPRGETLRAVLAGLKLLPAPLRWLVCSLGGPLPSTFIRLCQSGVQKINCSLGARSGGDAGILRCA